ncbi:MAG: ATP-binding protein [Solirubrobacterales bacterium]
MANFRLRFDNPAQTAVSPASTAQWGWVLAIFITITVITFAHMNTVINAFAVHEFLRRLYYIPIILAAYRFGLRGGLLASILCGLAYAPHLVLYLGTPELEVVNQLMEIALFVVVGTVTGILAGSERRQRLQLAAKVAQLEAMEAEVRAADRLAAVGRLAAGVAHEIRSPLGVIKAAAQLARDEKPDNREISESLDVIVQEVDRANQVVRGLLDFSRPQLPAVSEIDLAAVLDQSVQLLNRYGVHHQVPVDYDPYGKPLVLLGDAEMLKQAIVNLGLNAVQASQAGSRITMRLTGPRPGRPQAVIEIADQGSGIPPELLSQVFDPFFTTRDQGTGLGLAIVQRIVRDHCGQIEIQSSEGAGTIVRLILPAKEV